MSKIVLESQAYSWWDSTYTNVKVIQVVDETKRCAEGVFVHIKSPPYDNSLKPFENKRLRVTIEAVND